MRPSHSLFLEQSFLISVYSYSITDSLLTASFFFFNSIMLFLSCPLSLFVEGHFFHYEGQIVPETNRLNSCLFLKLLGYQFIIDGVIIFLRLSDVIFIVSFISSLGGRESDGSSVGSTLGCKVERSSLLWDMFQLNLSH